MKGGAGKNLEEGIEGEALEKHCLLAPLYDLFSLPYYIPQGHLCRDGTTHSGLSNPTRIINQENVPQVCLQTKWIGGIFLSFSDSPDLC